MEEKKLNETLNDEELELVAGGILIKEEIEERIKNMPAIPSVFLKNTYNPDDDQTFALAEEE